MCPGCGRSGKSKDRIIFFAQKCHSPRTFRTIQDGQHSTITAGPEYRISFLSLIMSYESTPEAQEFQELQELQELEELKELKEPEEEESKELEKQEKPDGPRPTMEDVFAAMMDCRATLTCDAEEAKEAPNRKRPRDDVSTSDLLTHVLGQLGEFMTDNREHHENPEIRALKKRAMEKILQVVEPLLRPNKELLN